MASCTSQHKELINGVGKCSVPMWSGIGMPAGFCDEPAYGAYIHGKTFTNAISGVTLRLDGRYCGYVPYLACPGHGGPKEKDPVLDTVERADWKGRPLYDGDGARKSSNDR